MWLYCWKKSTRKIKEFINNILSAKSAISSKRFTSLISLFLFAIVVIGAMFGIQIQDSIIYSLVSLILGSSILTLTQTQSNTKTEEIKTVKEPVGFKQEDKKVIENRS